MNPKYFSLIVFIPSLIYSFCFPSFQTVTLSLIALIFHAYESFFHLQKEKISGEQSKETQALQLQLAEIKDDVTKIKMAQGFKR